MARPQRKGLEYSPQDVDIHSDRKIRRLLTEFGACGYLVYDYVKCLCFKENGYWVGYDDGFCFDVADVLKSGTTEQSVLEILKGCFRMSLFNQEVFRAFRVITSKGIQERYLKAKKGGEILEKYDCINNLLIKSDETPENDDLSAQRKEKESKEKQRKEEQTKISRMLMDDWNLFAEKNGKAKILEITDKRMAKIRKRLSEEKFQFKNILIAADSSEYITGIDGGWFSFDWLIDSENNYLKVIEGNYKKGTNATSNHRSSAAATSENMLDYAAKLRAGLVADANQSGYTSHGDHKL